MGKDHSLNYYTIHFLVAIVFLIISFTIPMREDSIIGSIAPILVNNPIYIWILRLVFICASFGYGYKTLKQLRRSR